MYIVELCQPPGPRGWPGFCVYAKQGIFLNLPSTLSRRPEETMTPSACSASDNLHIRKFLIRLASIPTNQQGRGVISDRSRHATMIVARHA
jgi:hypothetical protein